ncbi:tripartite tricarboxylate transporter substrate binding protein [Aquabacter spiritensis]|uniref:Tripartite-type tricarboxylate transporter receptor subunit TctC n=1 Tax=Aquabacter spiritensis TaxID=933073 RepID=A0A4R3LZN1_9HYPH|nr:tripartite tricarboxylate transporter substrate binding protein [Aquabacter spiritensis]TCT06224.1 tripartite-type tricarboxylate transporter receptor subunit TctC [Aquabacter spiritensis]
MSIFARGARAALAGLLLSAVALGGALAQSGAPLRIIVPFPPGSGTDIVARLIAGELQPKLNQTVVVLNQAGGGGISATLATAKADPDGNTIFLTTSAHAILPKVKKDLPFDIVKDFAPVMLVCAGPLVLTVAAEFPAKDLKEMIALAKAKPGQIDYASSGIGTAPHLAMELLNAKAGIKMTHVPYRGGAPAIADVAAGNVPMYFGAPSSGLPFISAGKVRAIAVSSAKRAAFMPNVPTVQEQGIAEFDVELWYGILAPAKTPPARIAQLQKDISEILAKPSVRETMLGLGFEPRPSSSAAFAAYLDKEVKLWGEVADLAGMKPE